MRFPILFLLTLTTACGGSKGGGGGGGNGPAVPVAGAPAPAPTTPGSPTAVTDSPVKQYKSVTTYDGSGKVLETETVSVAYDQATRTRTEDTATTMDTVKLDRHSVTQYDGSDRPLTDTVSENGSPDHVTTYAYDGSGTSVTETETDQQGTVTVTTVTYVDASRSVELSRNEVSTGSDGTKRVREDTKSTCTPNAGELVCKSATGGATYQKIAGTWMPVSMDVKGTHMDLTYNAVAMVLEIKSKDGKTAGDSKFTYDASGYNVTESDLYVNGTLQSRSVYTY